MFILDKLDLLKIFPRKRAHKSPVRIENPVCLKISLGICNILSLDLFAQSDLVEELVLNDLSHQAVYQFNG